MIPPYVGLRQIADAVGWDIQYTRRFLKPSGILEKNGGLWRVADDRLREHYPAIYERVYAALAFAKSKRRQRTSTNVTKKAKRENPATRAGRT